MSKGEFELLDDVLCGVDTNPRRVKMAREIAHEAMKEIKAYRDFVKSIEQDMKEVQKMVSFAGLCFLFDAEPRGHEEIHKVIEKLEVIESDASSYV